MKKTVSNIFTNNQITVSAKSKKIDVYIEFAYSVNLFQQGKLNESIQILDEIIKIESQNPEFWHLKALILIKTKRLEEGIVAINQAIKCDEKNATHYNNFGAAFCEIGLFEESIIYFESAINLNNKYIQAYLNLGVAYSNLMRLEDSLIIFEKLLLIDPKNIIANVAKGNILISLQRYKEAIVCFDNANTVDPYAAEIYSFRGDAFGYLKKYEEAIIDYDKAIKINKYFHEAYLNRGVALDKLMRFEEALVSVEKAIEINPKNHEAYANCGMILENLNRFKEALSCIDISISLHDKFSDGYIYRGNILKKLNRFEDALISYDKAIEIDANRAEAYSNRGVVFEILNRFEDALMNYDKAIEINPGYIEAYWNKSLTLLLIGNYSKGWEFYEYRWKLEKIGLNPRNFDKPLWLGDQKISGKTILLHAEQGLGDTIQFCRYIKSVKALNARVVLEVPKALINLMSSLSGVDEIIESGQALPTFDFHCPLMSLPLAFKTTLDSIPECPEFVISEFKKNYWAHKLGLHEKFRVGLVWNGGFRPNRPELWSVNERRNLPLDHLKILKGLDVEFISLQKGEPAETEFRRSVAQGWDGPTIKDFVNELNDFSDTAALVMQLDLVIAVDTSTAHLAASLGKPVWLLNRFDSCWRWLIQRENSPWYPNVKLYRQSDIGDWVNVMQRVRADLDNSSRGHSY